MISETITQLATPPNRVAMSSRQVESVLSLLVALGVGASLYYGWLHRMDSWINPEEGIGYALGIIGGSLMLLLLVYPFRKRIPMLRGIGSVGFWFRSHMVLGLIGPVFILYHSRFSWGALNSAVALTAMLIVAGSGLIGRFLYARVHRGYSGSKLEIRALLQEMKALQANLAASGADGLVIQARLVPYEQQAVAAGAGFWKSARSVFRIGIGTRMEYRRIRRDIRAMPLPSGVTPARHREVRKLLIRQTAAYFQAVRHAAAFAFYDRMLRLWHLLHMPLFIILVGTAILHIVAVHMY